MDKGTYTGTPAQESQAKTSPVTQKTGKNKQPKAVVIQNHSVSEIISTQIPPYHLTTLSPQLSNSTEFLIRILDIVGSIAIFLLTAPIMLVIAILIKISSSGPILYRQKRVGKNGKTFILYKFRTMINNAEKHLGPVWAGQDDPRVTPVGRLLRRTRLDELPQLFNILRGDMSLVGPRPERPFFVKQHKALQGIRLAVKPGLTGLAQIRNSYNLKPEHKIKYDYLYIQKRSLLLNLYILLKTVPVIFCKKGW